MIKPDKSFNIAAPSGSWGRIIRKLSVYVTAKSA